MGSPALVWVPSACLAAECLAAKCFMASVGVGSPRQFINHPRQPTFLGGGQQKAAVGWNCAERKTADGLCI